MANYTAFDPTYGTLEDFDELVARRTRAASASFSDMVFNYTSTQHARFRESLMINRARTASSISADGTPDRFPTTGAPNLAGNARAGTPKASSIILHLVRPEQADLTGKTGARRAEKCASSGPIAA